MRTGLLETVAQVIEAHCWWLRVVDTHEYQVYFFKRDDHLQTTACRCLTLEVTQARGEYQVGHRWQISEPELDKVLDDMRQSSIRLRRRCQKLTLTEQDVEELVKRASYGVINLDLQGETNNPIIN